METRNQELERCVDEQERIIQALAEGMHPWVRRVNRALNFNEVIPDHAESPPVAGPPRTDRRGQRARRHQGPPRWLSSSGSGEDPINILDDSEDDDERLRRGPPPAPVRPGPIPPPVPHPRFGSLIPIRDSSLEL